VKPPIAPRAKCGLDKITTEIVKMPKVKILTINGIKGVWVPLHPLAVEQNTKHAS
jgi:hypothetical protein